jgi:hypothetical protein
MSWVVICLECEGLWREVVRLVIFGHRCIYSKCVVGVFFMRSSFCNCSGWIGYYMLKNVWRLCVIVWGFLIFWWFSSFSLDNGFCDPMNFLTNKLLICIKNNNKVQHLKAWWNLKSKLNCKHNLILKGLDSRGKLNLTHLVIYIYPN